MYFEGLLNLSVWEYIGTTLLLTHITIASVTIYLHRHQSHSALSLHPVASHFFRFWLWVTTGIITKEWVAIHRKHHAKCETPEDPHSPRYKGIGNILFSGATLYRLEARNEETLIKYGNGTPDDWMERNVYTRFPVMGIASMAVLDMMLFGAIGLIIFAVQMMWIPFWAAGVVNGLGHYLGYRNFETPDTSTNIIPWGILIGGEELHNNHHAYAASAKLSNKWWELDIGWLYIRMLALFKLAKIRRVTPKTLREKNRQIIDMDTVRAVVSNRFYILKLYGGHVIKPILAEAKQNANKKQRQLLRRARKLMIRESIDLQEKHHAIINSALQQCQVLKTVYQFKQQLKEIWVKTSNNQANRVKRLQQWCAEAEQTGIKALQDFAQQLKTYQLQEA